MDDEITNCSIRDACGRAVSTWIILLDNIPTAAMFLLGTALVWMAWGPAAIFMLLYNLLAIVLFWSLICRHCAHFGTRACPCGYGVIAARFFQKIEGSDFRKIFRKNIAVMYPCWFIPFGAGIYLLGTRFSKGALVIFAAFVVIAFILIPAISRLVGCKGCDLKNQCPWMAALPASKSRPLPDAGTLSQ